MHLQSQESFAGLEGVTLPNCLESLRFGYGFNQSLEGEGC